MQQEIVDAKNMEESMFCYRCIAVNVNSNNLDCMIHEVKRKIGDTGLEGCGRRSEKRIENEMNKVLRNMCNESVQFTQL